MQIMDKIVLDHGTGAKLSGDLVAAIVNGLGDACVGEMEDSSVADIITKKIAITTDSFVVTPIFFGNGDIGKISICGTVNDLAVSGAKPMYLTLAMVLEVGFPISDLMHIVSSISKTAIEANVKIVAGDTKVVNKGEVDKVFINTTGIGIFERTPLTFKSIKPSDKIILSSQLGDHSIHILSVREGLGFDQKVESDCAPLNDLIDKVLNSVPPGSVRIMRDVTRGGLSAVLNEFAKLTGLTMTYEESKLPLSPYTVMACDMLGVNPINLANEGCICFFVDPEYESLVLKTLKNHKYGKNASTVGIVNDTMIPQVIAIKKDGSKRIIEELIGAELPRLC
jgi:hydrogenase expression/formation protein HypE